MSFIKPKRKIDKVFLHCTAYANQDLVGRDLLTEVNMWHKRRGFKEIGYHYLIDKNGLLIEGRSLEKIPSAQQGHNSKTIAICLDGLYFEQFSEAQFQTLFELVNEIDCAYNYKITYHGHCEVSTKECPVFDYPAVLGLDRWGRRVGSFRNSIKPPEKMAINLSLTNRGAPVKLIQSALGITEDGIFGQETHQAVIKFQKEHYLEPDGIVGPITWEEILNQ